MSDKPLTQKMDDMDARLKKMEDEGKKIKERKFKVPWKIKGQLKKADKILVLLLMKNRNWMLCLGEIKEGLIHIVGRDDKEDYGYEPDAVYINRKKNLALVVIYQWRTLPVGGSFERYQEYKMLGTDNEVKEALALAALNSGQQVIIRGIEKAELEKDEKKKGGFGWLIWVAVAAGAAYLLYQMFKPGASK